VQGDNPRQVVLAKGAAVVIGRRKASNSTECVFMRNVVVVYMAVFKFGGRVGHVYMSLGGANLHFSDTFLEIPHQVLIRAF